MSNQVTPAMLIVNRARVIERQLATPSATNSDIRYQLHAELDRCTKQIDRIFSALLLGGQPVAPAIEEANLR